MKKLIAFTILLLPFVAFTQTVSFTADVTQGCLPLTVHFTNTSTGVDHYEWDFLGYGNNMSTGVNPSYTYTEQGYFLVRLTGFDAGNNSIGEYTEVIQVTGTDLAMSPNDTVCPGTRVWFHPEGNAQINSVFYDFGNNDTTSYAWDIDHVYDTAGVYQVTMIVDQAACGIDTIVKTVVVTNTAVPSVNIWASTNTVCPFDNIKFNTSNEMANQYFWNFDDGGTSTQMNPIHAFASIGNKVVTLTVTNTCGNSNTASAHIAVTDTLSLHLQINYWGNNTCPNTVMQFNNNSFGTFNWTFDTLGTATGNEVQFLFPDTGKYLVTLEGTNGCGSSDSTAEYVSIVYDTTNIPNVGFGFNNFEYTGGDTLTVCPGTKVNFTNNSEYENISFTWDFGDGTTSVLRDPTHIFNNLGTYTVKLTGENYCGGKNTATKIVLVNNSIYPNASLVSFPTTLCPGETVYFFNDQGGDEDLSSSSLSYSIWYGDGDSLINPTEYTDTALHIFTHHYNSIGTFNYLFQLTNTCGNSSQITGTITVDTTSGTPYDFTMEGDIFHEGDDPCPYDILEFYAVGGSSFFWDFGDGTTSTDMFPLHAYQDTGFYNVSLIVSNACGASDTLYNGANITGDNLPNPWFNMDNYQVCVNDTVHFYYDGGSYSDSYLYFWEFGDGTTSTQKDPIHIYSQVGNYTPKLVVTSGCGSDSSFNQIHVNGPKINFMADNTVSFPGTPIHFTNLTSNAISYLWNFGDGNTSTQTNPVHSYTSYGTYDITLTAIGFTGCVDSLTIPDYILISNMQIISQVHSPICHDDPAGIDVAVSGGVPPYSYLWSDGSTNQDLDLSNWVTGIETFSVTIVDNSGTTVEQSFTVTNPDPITLSVSTTDENCIGDGSGFATFNISGGVMPYLLEVNNQTYNITAPTYTIAGLDTGIYYYTLTDTNGCFVTGNFHIGWLGNQAFDSISHTNKSCNYADGTATVNTSTPATYYWNTGDTTATITGLSLGAYYVTVQNSNGCIDSTSVLIQTNNPPYCGIWPYNDAICPQEYILLSTYANTSHTIGYTWSTGSHSSAIAVSPGTYFVTINDVDLNCAQVIEATINECPPLNLSFIKENPTCPNSYDGKVKLDVSGSCSNLYHYEWSNGSTTDSIINRPSGTYYVTVYYSCDGSFILSDNVVDSVTLEDPEPLNTQIITSAVTFTNYSDGTADVLVLNGIPPYSYQWSTGETTSYISGKPAGTYFITVTDNNGCSTIDTAVIENQPTVPVNIQASGDTVFCEGNSITLDAGSGFDTYQWSTGTTNQTITVSETGDYSVLVSNGSSLGTDTIHVLVSHPFDQEEICVVTVDTALNKNKIVWEKTQNAGIVSYNIYRLYGSQYLQIGNVLYDDMSEFIDSSSTPEVHADRYKISVIDTCGNESALSPYHQTINLGATQSFISGNVIVVLDWNDYVDEAGNDTIDWYYIYTGATANTLQIFDSISATFTDFNIINPVNQYYFKVGAELETPCIPTSSAKANGGPYAQSVSNIDDYSVSTSIDNPDFQNIVLVYPNPFKDFTTIKFDNRDKTGYALTVFDITGQAVRKIDNITSDKIILQKDNLTPGFYSFELKGKYNYYGRLIITE